MSRLEEIKNTAYYTREGDSATHDVEYLLSKLETAEKALTKIIYSKLANINVKPEEIILMADDALHELHK